MEVRGIVSNLETTQLEASRELYTSLRGLRVAMDLGWIRTGSS